MSDGRTLTTPAAKCIGQSLAMDNWHQNIAGHFIWLQTLRVKLAFQASKHQTHSLYQSLACTLADCPKIWRHLGLHQMSAPSRPVCQPGPYLPRTCERSRKPIEGLSGRWSDRSYCIFVLQWVQGETGTLKDALVQGPGVFLGSQVKTSGGHMRRCSSSTRRCD